MALLVACAASAVSAVSTACGTDDPGAVSEGDASLPDASAPDTQRYNGEPADECQPKDITDVPVPATYAGKKSPLTVTPAVLMAGKARFLDRCAICHGSGGKGDGRGGPFVPPSADLTAQVRPDDYLFWRISEGGYAEPFCTAMPAFAKSFSESQRWELVAHMRELAGASDAGAADADADAAD